MLAQITVLALLWSSYLLLHSLLASGRFKTWFYVRFPHSKPYYRLAYNIIALMSFLSIWIYQRGLPNSWLYRASFIEKILALLLLATGILMMIWAFRHYNKSEFLGLKQYQGEAEENYEELNIHGLNRLVRHPLYLGLILTLLGYLWFHFTLNNTIMTACILVYLPFGIYWEEQKLKQRFGNAYLEYKRRVRCLIPFVF